MIRIYREVRFVLILNFLLYNGAVYAQTQPLTSNEFEVKGNIQGIKSGKIILLYPMLDSAISDTVNIVNGRFIFRGSVESPVSARLQLLSNRNLELNFYLENSRINVDINKDSLELSRVAGSRSNEDKDSVDAYLASYYKCLSSLKNVYDFAKDHSTPTISRDVSSIYDELPKVVKEMVVNYALSHPGSYAITESLFIRFTNDQTELPLLKKIYKGFTPEVKKSYGGKRIAELIKRIGRVQMGNIAPDFILPNERGREVRLSDFRGKYVLLDFWASWCVPCRAESPYLVRAFNKYKDKKFTIVGISLDTRIDKQKWIDAIKKDRLTWTQLSSLKGYEEKGVRQLYSVQGIPDNFLINPEGKIIARGLRGKEINKKLFEILN